MTSYDNLENVHKFGIEEIGDAFAMTLSTLTHANDLLSELLWEDVSQLRTNVFRKRFFKHSIVNRSLKTLACQQRRGHRKCRFLT